jgi:hypothetical protein
MRTLFKITIGIGRLALAAFLLVGTAIMNFIGFMICLIEHY